MDSAFAVFESLEEPTGAEEDWRYVDFELPFSSLAPVFTPGDRLAPGPFIDSLHRSSGRVLIVDGQVVEAESDGAVVSTLANMTEAPPWYLSTTTSWPRPTLLSPPTASSSTSPRERS